MRAHKACLAKHLAVMSSGLWSSTSHRAVAYGAGRLGMRGALLKSARLLLCFLGQWSVVSVRRGRVLLCARGWERLALRRHVW